MPSASYTFTMYVISGSANSTFTVVSSFEVTVFDPDDDYGVGDDQLADGSASETGALPTISALGAGAPAGWNVGDTFVFGAARGLDDDEIEDIYIPRVDGAWETDTAVFSVPGASVPLEVGQTYSMSSGGNVEQEVLPCFTAGTYILTDHGEVLVEDLETGDLVMTMDNGLQPIRWISSCTHAAIGPLAPILIRKGVLNNTRDLLVSPQHRVLLADWRADMLFGAAEVLATAKSLLSDGSVIRREGGTVTYYHLMFQAHEIIISNGAPTESFYPGACVMGGFGQSTRDEIFALFPNLCQNDFSGYGPAARMCLKRKEAELLVGYGVV